MAQPGGQLVTALCQVVFDIDVGQKVEAVHPPGALTPEEESDVAFHSFPVSAARLDSSLINHPIPQNAALGCLWSACKHRSLPKHLQCHQCALRPPSAANRTR